MGIYAKNREEWVMMDVANFKNSVVTIAFYDTLGPKAVEYVIHQTELTTISCSSNYLPALIKLKKDGFAHSISNIISFEKPSDELIESGKAVGISLHYFWDVVEAGKKETIALREPEPDTIYMFCYTSGTTGDPKAAMLTHKNLISVAVGAK